MTDLVTLFEGLVETKHLFVFFARQGCKELLTADGAADKTIPIILKLVIPLRVVVMSTDAGILTRLWRFEV